MNVSLTPTIDVLEVTWCVLAICGIVLHIRGWIRKNREVKFVLSRPDLAPDVDYPLSDRRDEFWRIFKQSLFLSAGLMLMTLPSAPPAAGAWRIFISWWVRVAFIGAELIMIYLSAREQYEGAARANRRENGHEPLQSA